MNAKRSGRSPREKIYTLMYAKMSSDLLHKLLKVKMNEMLNS